MMSCVPTWCKSWQMAYRHTLQLQHEHYSKLASVLHASHCCKMSLRDLSASSPVCVWMEVLVGMAEVTEWINWLWCEYASHLAGPLSAQQGGVFVVGSWLTSCSLFLVVLHGHLLLFLVFCTEPRCGSRPVYGTDWINTFIRKATVSSDLLFTCQCRYSLGFPAWDHHM